MKQVLIVDDNHDLAANIAEILEAHGNVALIAKDGREALELLEKTHFDAVLTDMRMPRLSGPGLLREIRKLHAELPVLAFTAYSASAEIAEAESLGLLAVLPKPVPVQRLVNLLAAARPGGIVLLVEDDDGLRENLAEVLRGKGLTVVSAPSVRAIDTLGDVKPFAALVDLRLPDAEDGESLERVRARFPKVPQVAVSAHPELLARASESVLKPFDVTTLLSRLEALYQARATP